MNNLKAKKNHNLSWTQKQKSPSIITTNALHKLKTIYSNCNTDFLSVIDVVVLLFYIHGKHLRSCRDGQLT